PAQGRYLRTGQQKHIINAHADIHASSGIRTHDLSVGKSEDGSCFRPRGQSERHEIKLPFKMYSSKLSLYVNRRLASG
ncbi:hypothetical protein B7P43_G14936, partial [Cryptotermes secundus]